VALFRFLFGKMNKEEHQTDDSTAGASATQSDSSPVYTLRIAVYDSMSVLPRTVDLSSDDFTSFVDEAASRIYSFCKERGGSMPFVVLREAVENLIHAGFEDAIVTIMPDGNVVRISDHGPGIKRKSQATMPGFTSTTASERELIRGVGSGFPIMIESLESLGGFLTMEDNLGSGLVVTLCSAAPSAGPGHGHRDPAGSHPARDAGNKPQPGWGGAYQYPPQVTPQQDTAEIWSSGQDALGIYQPSPQIPHGTYAPGGAFHGHAGMHPGTTDSGRLSAKHAEDDDHGEARGRASSSAQTESHSRNMENIAHEDEESISADKQDSAAEQSKRKQDEEPPSTSQPSDMSDEALGDLLSSRQKKVFMLIAEMGEIGPSIVTKELDISLSTAYRDLVTLEELGLVVSLEGGKRKLTRRGIDFLSYVFR
jgi:predicted transcriptional regulator